ncbi:hypothetical protein K438DRAFT_1053963 [Mycena galopus ATCC 62051]|nr:hypothetical protein K438DRAFT_1053963 [Mycena galopus ATCC 62051]
MAQHSIPPQIIAFFVFIILAFYLIPSLIDTYYPQTAPGPVTTFCIWYASTTERGVGALAFLNAIYVLYVLLRDITRSVVVTLSVLGRTPHPTPAALEAGGAPPPPTSTPKLRLPTRLFALAASALLFVFLGSSVDPTVLDAERPLREIVGAALQFLFEGLAVIFAAIMGGLIAAGVFWCWGFVDLETSRAPVPTGEVIFDETAAVEALVSDSKEEK